MKQNKFGEMIFEQDDVFDLLMSGYKLQDFDGMIVDQSVNIESAAFMLENVPKLVVYDSIVEELTVESFNQTQQTKWHMPEQYQQIDIAQYVLDRCTSDAELQRCGKELLLYQERGLFPLLQYLKYLVDLMTENRLIWGVGRGSSVASFVLYKIGVHRIDSLFYNLDVEEFLR